MGPGCFHRHAGRGRARCVNPDEGKAWGGRALDARGKGDGKGERGRSFLFLDCIKFVANVRIIAATNHQLSYAVRVNNTSIVTNQRGVLLYSGCTFHALCGIFTGG